MSSLLRLERKQKNSANPLRIRIFLFLSYSFGIETINTFIHSRSRSLENQTWFQINMGKSYTRFKIKKPQKPYADGAANTRPPPPPRLGPNCSLNPYPESTSDLIQILLKTSRIYSRVRISCKENKSNRGRLVQRCSKLRTTTFCKDLFLKKEKKKFDELATFFYRRQPWMSWTTNISWILKFWRYFEGFNVGNTSYNSEITSV